MKTLIKIFPFLALVCFFGVALSSCDDDCGCDPVIQHIIPADKTAKDSLIVGANSGEYIIIVGENLASVTGVFFDNTPAVLNPAFMTNNYIILQIPEVAASTQVIRLTTAQGRHLIENFMINIPPPEIRMFYSEFVEYDDILRVRGRFFFNPRVFFFDEDGNEIPAASVETKGSTEMFIKVPGEVTHSRPIVVYTGSGRTESRILFRDRRNIIIDFDEYTALNTGTMVMGGTGYPNYEPKWKEDLMHLLPEEYHGEGKLPKGCDGLYDQINVIDRWGAPGSLIAYHIAAVGREFPRPLVGDFASYDVRELVLKFEVYTPKAYSINGIYATIAFPPRGNAWNATGGRDLSKSDNPNISVPAAWFCPFELDIDRSNPDSWGWTKGIGATNVRTPFFTDWEELSHKGNWMTVSIPLSTFIWNVVDRSIFSVMQENFAVNMPFPYRAINTELTKDWDKDMGEFMFMWEPEQWSPSDQTGGSGSFLFFVDNFRVVPDDGGGVQFGKVGQRAPTGNPFTGGRPFN